MDRAAGLTCTLIYGTTIIDGLHVTSWGPCWCTGKITFFLHSKKTSNFMQTI